MIALARVMASCCGETALGIEAHMPFQMLPEKRHGVMRFVAEAVIHDHGLDVGIEDDRQNGILETAHRDRFVDELIAWSPDSPQLLARPLPVRRRGGGDRQNFKIGAVGLLTRGVGLHFLGHRQFTLILRLPGARIFPVRFGKQGGDDLLGEPGQTDGIAGEDPFLQSPHQFRPGIGPERFQGSKIIADRCRFRLELFCRTGPLLLHFPMTGRWC